MSASHARSRRSSRPPRSPDTVRSSLRAVALLLAALTFAGAVAASGAGTASAHTDLDYTVPSAEDSVADPVSVITVAFADPVTVTGSGFEVFTPAQAIVKPAFSTNDNITFFLQLDEPLAGGEVGVRYEVAAADGHIIDGSFTFTVLAAAPTQGAPTSATSIIAVPTSSSPEASPVAGTEPTDGRSNAGLIVGLLAALVVGLGAVLVVRTRHSVPA